MRIELHVRGGDEEGGEADGADDVKENHDVSFAHELVEPPDDHDTYTHAPSAEALPASDGVGKVQEPEQRQPRVARPDSPPASFLSKIDPPILACLEKYLHRCCELGTGPAGFFLHNPASHRLDLSGRLLPGIKTVLSVSAALENASWLTYLDLSDNDLRASGTLAICKALLASNNALAYLLLDRNNMGCIELVHKAIEWPDATDIAKREAQDDRRAGVPVLQRNFLLRCATHECACLFELQRKR